MLTKYLPQIAERQRTRFPEYISQLEGLSKGQEGPTLKVLALVIHNMRNDLAIVAMVFELQALAKPDNVPCEVV